MSAEIIYVPSMCDHAVAMAAGMRYHGLPAVVMPPSDAETLAIGQTLCLGKECLPCFTCIGDIVRQSRQPGFVAERSALLMPTTAGPCRFGQYSALHREVLAGLGLGALQLLSPTAENSYQGFGKRPTALRLLIWRGAVGVDGLLKLRHAYRPYEAQPGAVDALYAALLHELAVAIEQGGGRRAVAVMRRAAAQFRSLPVVRPAEARPRIGLVGEIYLRNNDFTNQGIVRRIEQLGGEVWSATLMEWFYFTNYGTLERSWAAGDYGGWLKTALADRVQQHIEHEMLAPLAGLLPHHHETAVAALMENARPYYDPALGTEAALSLGKAVDLARLGVAGIIHVLPLSCMPGTTVTGIAPRLRADHDRLPWLDIIYDAQEITNINTRLEAFMYQAREYQRRRR